LSLSSSTSRALIHWPVQSAWLRNHFLVKQEGETVGLRRADDNHFILLFRVEGLLCSPHIHGYGPSDNLTLPGDQVEGNVVLLRLQYLRNHAAPIPLYPVVALAAIASRRVAHVVLKTRQPGVAAAAA